MVQIEYFTRILQSSRPMSAGKPFRKASRRTFKRPRHGPFIPELEFTEGGILPFQQIFRPAALGSLEEGLARARLCNGRVQIPD
jgi:hypothetical protein